MAKAQNLQDSFLARVRQERLPVTVFLVNGFQLRGQISGFDPFVVVLMSDGKQQLIYKHAISTIVPQHPILLTEKPAAPSASTEAPAC
jgi:host factor-I protein